MLKTNNRFEIEIWIVCRQKVNTEKSEIITFTILFTISHLESSSFDSQCTVTGKY